MSKIVIVVLMALLLVAVPLAGACAQPAPAPAPAPAPKPTPAPAPKPAPAPAPAPKPAPAPAPAPPEGELPEFIKGGASGKGKAYSLSAYIIEMIGKYTPMKPQFRKTTTSVEAFTSIVAGDLHIAMYSTTAPSALRQLGQDLPLRVLFCGGGATSSTLVGYFTKPRDDIMVFANLRGTRVFACKPGNIWACPITDALLKVNNMTRDDFRWLEYSATADSFRSVEEGRVDCIQSVAGASTAKMASTVGLYVIPFSEKEQQAIVDLRFGFLPLVWPAGMFGNTVDTASIAAPNTALVSKDMSDFMAYTITKTFFEHLKEFQTSQKAGEGFTKEAALLQWALPYHAGAIEYYKEQGMWGSGEETKQAALLKAEGATR